MLSTVVFGNAKPYLNHIIRNQSKNNPPVNKKKLNDRCSRSKAAMCTPVSSVYLENLIQEVIDAENLEVRIWNAGIEIRTLREKNTEDPQATQIELHIREAQASVRRQCDNLLDTVGKIAPNTSQVDPATWTAHEKMRLRTLRARFGAMPASMDHAREPAPTSKLRYQDRSPAARVVFWARGRLLMLDMLPTWLGFASHAFNIKANLSVPEIRSYLLFFWSHAVDAHFMRIQSFHKEQAEWVLRGAQGGLNQAANKVMLREKRAYTKYVESLPREYNEWCERRMKEMASALPLPDLDKVLVTPGSRSRTF